MKNTLQIFSVPVALFAVWFTLGIQHETALNGLILLVTLVLLPSIVLLFVNEKAINPWWYFSIIYWLAVLVYLSAAGRGLWGYGLGVFLLAWPYLLLSLAIIAVKSWKLRGK